MEDGGTGGATDALGLPGTAYPTKKKKMAEEKQSARREGQESCRIVSVVWTLPLKAIFCVDLQGREQKGIFCLLFNKKAPNDFD